MNDSILRDYTKFRRVRFDDFELDSSHASSDEERVALADRSVC